MTRRTIFRISLATITAAVLFAVLSPHSWHPSRTYQAPDFMLHDLHGNPVRLSDLRGKAVVINFWATWCPPCRREIPWFIRLQQKYGTQGLQIVGISMDDDNPDGVSAFVRKMGINYPILLGNDHVASLYGGADVLPTTYYIARDGSVVTTITGLISEDKVEENIRRALSEHSSASSSQIAVR